MQVKYFTGIKILPDYQGKRLKNSGIKRSVLFFRCIICFLSVPCLKMFCCQLCRIKMTGILMNVLKNLLEELVYGNIKTKNLSYCRAGKFNAQLFLGVL